MHPSSPGEAPAIDARAEALPFADGSFDAAMACVTIHHWDPPEAGLRELRRVARGPVVVFTFELESLPACPVGLGPAGAEDRIVARLGAALESGAWDAEHGHLRGQESFDGALRLVVSEPLGSFDPL